MFKISKLRTKVWVRRENYWNSAISENTAIEITEWVEALNLGHRTAHDQWKLNSKEAVMMFMLVWG